MNTTLTQAFITGCALFMTAAAAAMPAPASNQPVFEAEVRADVDAATLDAEWRIAFVANERTADGVAFGLNGGLQVNRVAGGRVRGHAIMPAEQMPSWNMVQVNLAEGVAPGDIVTIEIAYSGAPEMPENRINSLTPEWVELSVDSGWHPLFLTFDQMMRGTLRLALPESWTVISGSPVEFRDGLHVIDIAQPSLDVAFSAAPQIARIEAEGFAIYHRGAQAAQVQALADSAAACAAYMNALFGEANPLSGMRLVMVDRAESAYVRFNYITVSHFDPEDSQATDQFICHEMAHHWSTPTDFTSADHWMTEGIAEYLALRFIRDRYGEEAFDRIVARYEGMSQELGPVWTPDQRRGPFMLMYRKAPVLLARLESRIGAAAFEETMRRYAALDSVTTPAFLELLAGVAGADAAEAFRADLGRDGREN